MDRAAITTRFAPSPTGGLHLGNARTALFSYLHARGGGGRFVLRIEDTDAGRSDAAHEAAILRELRWLGLEWDGEPARQSERGEIYAEHLARLLENGRVYPCWRTDEELAEFRRAAAAAGRPPVYDRRWGRLPPAEIARRGAAGQRPVLRFRVPDDGEVVFEDLVRGEHRFPIAAIGDFVVQRSDGSTPFFFGNAVDDAEGAITDVLRGEDHLSNTPRQLLLLDALGLPAPRYGHLPLVVDEDGAPLAKRRGAPTLSALAAEGLMPAAVVNYLARLGHSYDDGELAGLAELARDFRIERVGRAPARFDAAQLEHWQHLALQACDEDTLLRWAGDAAVAPVPEAARERFVQTVRPNIARPGDMARWAQILYGDDLPGAVPADPGAADVCAAAVAALDQGATDLRGMAASITGRTGARGRRLFRPLRLALTGMAEGPELGPLLELMGPERARRRFAARAVGAAARTDQA
jgi:nondiscriminating glutamyl-tRNA synthetase